MYKKILAFFVLAFFLSSSLVSAGTVVGAPIEEESSLGESYTAFPLEDEETPAETEVQEMVLVDTEEVSSEVEYEYTTDEDQEVKFKNRRVGPIRKAQASEVTSKVVAEEGERLECWEDQPKFVPGFDVGIYTWQGTCNGNHFMQFSSDSKLVKNYGSEETYHFEGTITTDGEFLNIGTNNIEGITWTENTITIDITLEAGQPLAGLNFFSTGDTITFDLKVNGENYEDLIYIGKTYTNPESTPFVLDNKEFEEPKVICEEDELFKKGECMALDELDSEEKSFSLKTFFQKMFRSKKASQEVENLESLEA